MKTGSPMRFRSAWPPVRRSPLEGRSGCTTSNDRRMLVGRLGSMVASVVLADAYGSVIDWADDDFIELRWYDTTKGLTTAAFNEWQTKWAEQVEKAGRSRALVDVQQFQMTAEQDPDHRTKSILPRYDRAGVTKFAFLSDPDNNLVGQDPEPEGDHLSAWFGSRADVMAWFTE